MSTTLRDVYSLETMLRYCAGTLHWPIEEEWFEDVDDLVYDFSAADLGIKDEEFSKIQSLKQLRPLVDDQPWGIFAVEFEGKRLEVSALRRILRSLIPNRNNTDFKTWDYDRILFLCLWGEASFKTIGFAAFQYNGDALPLLKTLYCNPRLEDPGHLENFESRIRVLEWPNISDSFSWIEKWSRIFAPARGQTIHDTIQLTETLAGAAKSISDTLNNSFSVETGNGFAHRLYYRFNNALRIELSQKDFIDMYAQTIVYGLFSARCMHPEALPFTAENAVNCIPETNPLLKDLLVEYCTPSSEMQFDELEITDLINALNNTDITNILADFNRQTGYGKEDPIVYFYEKFLDIYEREEKKRRGVYYTPTPAVNFIVHSISAVLKEKFNCSTGFLDPGVSILDPATGTGTFLRSIILTMSKDYKNTHKNDLSGWSEYVTTNMLTRLYGFEFMMAPYAVAHMKLAMTLKDTGYNFAPGHRLQVYLANSLECGESLAHVDNSDDPLQKESNYAALVKSSKINVVLGNPPYRTDSVNKGDWIMQLMDDYKHEPGQAIRLQERNPKVVNDDYVKFIRFAQEIIKNEEKAIIGYVTPHSFTDNLTFRGMRWVLMHSFDEIYILDLHGNVMSRESTGLEERDENIFDIQQGVCICFFIKKTNGSNKTAVINYSELFGSREKKYQFLSKSTINDISWTTVTPASPYYFFKPKDLSLAPEYDNGIQLSSLFPNYLGGIKTHSDATLVAPAAFTTGYDQLYDYRPFDIQHINYDLSKVERNRYDIMKHFVGHFNYGLVMDRQVVTDNWSHIQIVRNMIDNRVHYSRKGIPVECPMFLYDERGNAKPNIDETQLAEFTAGLSESFSEELTDDTSKYDMIDVFDYCYGILSSNTYRTKYLELLSIDFPRVPAPINSHFFRQVTRLGAYLRKLHLLEHPIENTLNIEFIGTGDNVVSSVQLRNNRAYINRTQYFSNIREDLWDFCFAGYHGLQKWFKDRRQKALSSDDIQHVIDVFNVFDQSESYMSELDTVLNEFGII